MVKHAKPEDVGDPKQFLSKEQKIKLRRERDLDDMNQVMKTSYGKGFIWRILEKCHMFHTTSHHEPTRMAVMSGERDIGLWLLDELREADPNAYIKLYQEKQKRDDK
jgi:hypothetical protein|tara:strand:+ start:143 stop:463 length:321 start_codon:yes stop_codon:yes gene_type:complete